LRKYALWAGGVLTTAVVIPLVTWGVISGKDWISDKFNPKPYLSAVVSIPTLAKGPPGFCEQSRVFDKSPPQLPSLPKNFDDLDGWVAANGGIPASGSYIKVALQGLYGHNVLVHDISVNIVSHREPLHGTYADFAKQCGGYVPYRFSLNLDARPVSVTVEAAEGGGEGPPGSPSVDLPHRISGSEPEVWNLSAVTKTCTCEWTATLNWTADDGRKGTTEINDHGHPFRVAASALATHYVMRPISGRATGTYCPRRPPCRFIQTPAKVGGFASHFKVVVRSRYCMSDVVTYRPYDLKFLGENVPKSLLLVTRHIPFPGKDGVMSGGSSRGYPLEPRERATLNAGDQPPAEMRYQKVSGHPGAVHAWNRLY
jgi:hypothetical protein